MWVGSYYMCLSVCNLSSLCHEKSSNFYETNCLTTEIHLPCKLPLSSCLKKLTVSHFYKPQIPYNKETCLCQTNGL